MTGQHAAADGDAVGEAVTALPSAELGEMLVNYDGWFPEFPEATLDGCE